MSEMRKLTAVLQEMGAHFVEKADDYSGDEWDWKPEVVRASRAQVSIGTISLVTLHFDERGTFVGWEDGETGEFVRRGAVLPDDE
jgi:hypothetical protein